jgi:hypothetical protein
MRVLALAACVMALLCEAGGAELTDITQPGDPIVPTSYNSPGSEGVAQAIDNSPSKYLNFDKLNAGFTVTPRAGPRVVIGLTLMSANDRPEGDPASYLLEGSNDGMNFLLISSNSVPPFPARFYKQEFWFLEHTNSFTSYRLIFPTIANPTTALAMHISEVELLSEVSTNVYPCTNNPALIARQPEDTPVLPGARATFKVSLTGPWYLQWYRNGVEIPGATSYSYTTPPATAADDGTRFHARVSRQGCYTDTDEVMLNIFTPSEIESIGLDWLGHRAGGGPIGLHPEQILGVHPQAYWNRLDGATGAVTRLTNSNNQPHPQISVHWATTRQWGFVASEEGAMDRMFDGLVISHGTNDATAQTLTFSNVPPGSHTLLLYTVQYPLDFFSLDVQVLTFSADGTPASTQQGFIRPQNYYEYRDSGRFVVVASNTPETRGVGNTLRIDNLQPGDGRIHLHFFSPDWTEPPPPSDRATGPGLNGLQLVLNPNGVQTHLEGLSRSGTTASFTFSTIRELIYTVEYTDDLKQPITWTPLLPLIAGTGSSATAVDSAADVNMRFYRVRIE